MLGLCRLVDGLCELSTVGASQHPFHASGAVPELDPVRQAFGLTFVGSCRDVCVAVFAPLDHHRLHAERVSASVSRPVPAGQDAPLMAEYDKPLWVLARRLVVSCI